MNEEYQRQFERFNADVASHSVRVLREDGLYRHLRCSSGGYAYSFDIITWPGYLCYCGDMGSFVFTRLPDMFEFFRGRQTALIDHGYLAEKAVAVDKPDGLRVFSEERFREAVRSDFESFTEDWDAANRAVVWEDVEAEVLSYVDDGRNAAVGAAMEFRCDKREVFPDFWEHRLEEYTGRFWWCCYAIPWAIEKYDAQALERAS